MQSVDADSTYLLSTCHYINCVLPTYVYGQSSLPNKNTYPQIKDQTASYIICTSKNFFSKIINH